MAQVQLTVETRAERGKGAAHRLRRRGFIPAVLYGGTCGNVLIAVNSHELRPIVAKGAGETTLIDLTIQQEGQTRTIPVIIKDLQIDPVKRTPIHADFLEVSMEQTIEIHIPIQLIGDAAGVKEGGIVDILTREIAVECLPGKMVDHFDLDISALKIGDSLTVATLSIGEDYKILTDPGTVIVSIGAPSMKEEEEKPEVVEGPAEPEVIQKGKKPEEEEQA